jgi:hypothetical protein
MVAILKILFKTKDTYDYLDNQYEDELDTNCNLIFGIFGAISGFESFYRDLNHIKDFTGNGGLITLCILSAALGAGFGLLIGRYLLTYTLYGLGRLIKGIGEVIDIRVVSAYSMIPTILKLPIVLYLGLSGKFNNVVGLEYWVINGFYFLIWIWTLKIMTQGLMRFHKFGIGKALITISPLLIIGLGYYALYYIINH